MNLKFYTMLSFFVIGYLTETCLGSYLFNPVQQQYQQYDFTTTNPSKTSTKSSSSDNLGVIPSQKPGMLSKTLQKTNLNLNTVPQKNMVLLENESNLRQQLLNLNPHDDLLEQKLNNILISYNALNPSQEQLDAFKKFYEEERSRLLKESKQTFLGSMISKATGWFFNKIRPNKKLKEIKDEAIDVASQGKDPQVLIKQMLTLTPDQKEEVLNQWLKSARGKIKASKDAQANLDKFQLNLIELLKGTNRQLEKYEKEIVLTTNDDFNIQQINSQANIKFSIFYKGSELNTIKTEERYYNQKTGLKVYYQPTSLMDQFSSTLGKGFKEALKS